MALLSMAVHSTTENGRAWMTQKTLESLAKTVDWSKHRMFIIDNASCAEAKELFVRSSHWLPFTLITNEKNEGTARAHNRAWLNRKEDENAIKIDDDVEIHQAGWVDILEECIQREPMIGCLGLKRKDLGESPHEPVGGFLHSELVMLPHELGQSWLVVEVVRQVLATCCLYSAELLRRVGFLYQSNFTYSFDDCLMAARCEKAGLVSAFYPHISISHIDPGGDKFCEWKVKRAAECIGEFSRIREEYMSGKRPIYQGPFDD